MKYEFLVNFSSKKNIESILEGKEFWFTPPSPKDFFERECYRFVPANISTEMKTKIIAFFEKARYWGCFVKIDIEAENPEEAKKLLKTDLHLFSVSYNMVHDKSLSYSTEAFIIFDKCSFEKDLERAAQSQIPMFKCTRKRMSYESDLLQSEVTINIDAGQARADFSKSNIHRHLKHKKDPITNEWYFGEDEFRYLLTAENIDDISTIPDKVVIALSPSTFVDVGTYNLSDFFESSLGAFDLDRFTAWYNVLPDSSNLVLLCNPETFQKLKEQGYYKRPGN